MNAPHKVSPFWNFFQWKSLRQKISPQNYIKSAKKPKCQRKNLLLSCGQTQKDGEIKWMRPNRRPNFEIFFNEKAFGKSLAPKLHQVSEKALMPTKKLITVVWSSIKRLRDQMNAPQQVPPFWNFFQWKNLRKKSRPKITSSQRKSLNANEKAYCCRVVKH